MSVRVGDTAINLFIVVAFRNVLRNLKQNTENTVIHVFIFTSLYLLLLKLINGSIFISEEFNLMFFFTESICFTFFGM